MNEFALMAELKDTALRAERLAQDNERLRKLVAEVEWCSWQNSCPECGFSKPKHNPDGCKLQDVLRKHWNQLTTI